MKVLFAGPSLHGTKWAKCPGRIHTIECRGPAAQGDLARAVVDGASAIGLVDGLFDNVAAVWHKEILYAIEQGVEVIGAASMGALRAAECAKFGMIGIGHVFQRYHCGELVDDAAVAVSHAPAELGYQPLSEPLVNVQATIDRLLWLNLITSDEASRLYTAAHGIFFKQRTYCAIISGAELGDKQRGEVVGKLLQRYRIDIKRNDALMLVGRLKESASARNVWRADWRVEPTITWLRTLEHAHANAHSAASAAAIAN